MKKNKLLTIAAMLGVFMLLAAAAVFVGPADESDADPVDFIGLGYKPISTPQDLAKIGKDPAYPLNEKYYLTNDIIFTPADDTNGGVAIAMTAVVLGTGLTITIAPANGNVTSLYAWVGTVHDVSTSGNNVTLTNIPQGVFTLSVGGMLSSSVPFAYSMEIDTTVQGVNTGAFNSNGNFDPIGNSYNNTFTGIFNGNGHKISGMNVAVFGTSYTYAGLFGYATGAQISDLGMEDGSVIATSASGELRVGGIVGYARAHYETPTPQIITDCYNTSSVTAASSTASRVYAGGIAGHFYTESSTSTMSGCNNSGTIVSTSLAGGIAGFAQSYRQGNQALPTSIITDCYNTGLVIASSPQYTTYAGGITADASVLASTMTSEAYLTMTDCYNTGSIAASSASGGAYAGGITAYTSAFDKSSNMTISNCYNAGSVDASASVSQQPSSAGGIVGQATVNTSESSSDSIITITGCYNAGPITALVNAGGIVGYASSTSFSEPSSATLIITDCYNTAPVTALSLSTISRAGGVVGYALSHASSSILSTLTITGCYNTGAVISSSSQNSSAGGIAGYVHAYAASSAYSAFTIADCYNTGSVAASSSDPNHQSNAGGIAGFAQGQSSAAPLTLTITGSYNTGAVTSSSALYDACSGGIAGYLHSTASSSSIFTIADCYNAGPVAASTPSSNWSHAGGIAGYAYASSNSQSPIDMINCYSIGTVAASSQGNAYAGGIASYIGSMLNVKITNCYFLEGQITLRGAPYADKICDYAEWAIVVDGYDYATERPGIQGSGAKSASDMRPSIGDAAAGNSVYFTGTTTVGSAIVNGWDFDNVWTIVAGANDGYPILRALIVSGEFDNKTLSGVVTVGAYPVAGATVSYNGTSVTTDSSGRYAITVPYGTVVTITGVTKAGHALITSLPPAFTLTSDIVQNFTMDKVLLEVSSKRIGSIGIIEGTADISSGAKWVSVNVRFSDDSYQRTVSKLIYDGSTAEIYSEFSSGSAQPTMYLVIISDERPAYGEIYIPLAMEAGGF